MKKKKHQIKHVIIGVPTLAMKVEFDLMLLHLTTPHVRGHHLNTNERDQIQFGHDSGLSNREIARQLGISRQTIDNEINRGTVKQVTNYNGQRVYRYEYNHDSAQDRYERERLKCHRHRKLSDVGDFLAYTVSQFKTKHWSLDAIVGRAKSRNLFRPEEMVCTTTLYNYIDDQLLEIKNIDLTSKLLRQAKKHKTKKHKRILGRGIEERPKSIDTREEFGHFELDTVQGKRDGQESVILTLIERKSRFQILRLIDGRDADSVVYEMHKIMKEYGSCIKTITADNGSEFADLNQLAVDVYYASPYSAWQRGTNENHNRMIRRFIPKGVSMDLATPKQVETIATTLNQLPRKIFGYKTPEEQFQSCIVGC